MVEILLHIAHAPSRQHLGRAVWESSEREIVLLVVIRATVRVTQKQLSYITCGFWHVVLVLGLSALLRLARHVDHRRRGLEAGAMCA